MPYFEKSYRCLIRATLDEISKALSDRTAGKWVGDKWGGITTDDGTRVCCGALLECHDGDLLRQAPEMMEWMISTINGLMAVLEELTDDQGQAKQDENG
jgi:hypothetical protein